MRYTSGSSILITDVGAILAPGRYKPGSSLVCMTQMVNSHCCRRRDGGNVGEWYFPNGSIVPRNRYLPNGDFSRSGYNQQVRLSRRNNALGPIGVYTCKVPGEGSNGGLLHSASITLGKFNILCIICMHANAMS